MTDIYKDNIICRKYIYRYIIDIDKDSKYSENSSEQVKRQ